MTFDNHSNFSVSRIVTAPSPATTGTSITITTGDGAIFPTPPFNVTIWPFGVAPLVSNAEIVRVTAMVGDTFTILRAQENTIAKSIATGNYIAATITVKVIKDIEDAVNNAQSNIIQLTAGETISGGKAVVVSTDGNAYVYDINNEDHYGKNCGIAKQAASAGQQLDIFIQGQAYEAGVGWISGVSYYVSSTGVLTSIPPSTGLVKMIGVGIGQDKILLNGCVELITI